VRAIVVSVVALAALTALVLGGVLTGLDEWGLDHVMPALDPRAHGQGIVSSKGIWRPFPLDGPWWQKALDLYTYPGSVFASMILVAVACVVLWRRQHRFAALVWLGAWGAGSAIELAGKHLLTRPSLHWANGHIRLQVVPYANSYPSGHTVRSVVIAAVLIYVWPRARVPLAVWLAFVPVCLVVAAAHTITDVIGGLILGWLIVLVAHAMIRMWTPSQAYSSSSSRASSETRRSSWPIWRARRSSSPPAS
jgi:membrane-associated phospholipid phosphatase